MRKASLIKAIFSDYNIEEREYLHSYKLPILKYVLIALEKIVNF